MLEGGFPNQIRRKKGCFRSSPRNNPKPNTEEGGERKVKGSTLNVVGAKKGGCNESRADPQEKEVLLKSGRLPSNSGGRRGKL